jgi:hypothetical protein
VIALTFFDHSEFACPCCGENRMDSVYLMTLDRARGNAGIPFVVTSGYRCEAHNAAVGGVPGSAHTKGLAADIATPDSRSRFLIVSALIAQGITRIGIADNMIHSDMDSSKPAPVIWTY